MFKNYLKIALRNLIKQKTYSVINILGLAMGMAISILILLWVIDELSYDKFNENYEQICQVFEKQYYSNQEIFAVTATPYPLGPALKEEYPEIKYSTRFDSFSGRNVKLEYESNKFIENATFVDPDFLKMFSFKTLQGNKENALDNPNSIVLTERIAEKYFGKTDPIGKVMKGSGRFDFVVTAVLENPPVNSSIQFEILINIDFLRVSELRDLTPWSSNNVNTFIQLDKNIDESLLSAKIKNRLKEHQRNMGTELYLHPYSRVHLYTIEDSRGTGRIQNVIIFSIIALFILLIASINFINLSTARATKRFKEVGLKKVIGATRSQVAQQFFGESVLMALLSLVLALMAVFLLLPEFNYVTGKQISIQYLSIDFYLIVLLVTLFVGIVSGTYPSLYLSKYTPVEILNERGKGKASSTKLRTALVVFQFTISVMLILATIVLYKQTDFLLNKDTGFSKENVVFVNLDEELRNNLEPIKKELVNLASVKVVSSASHLPFAVYWNGGGYRWEGMQDGIDPLVTSARTDRNWWKVFDMKIVDGRGLSDERDSEQPNNILINETFAKMISEDGLAAGKVLSRGDDNYNIVGVVKDFDYLGLRGQIGPLIIYPLTSSDFLFVKIAEENQTGTIEQIRNVISNVVLGASPTITFLSDTFNSQFDDEEKEQKLAGYFTLLTIIIASLGLFGLSAFIAEQKRREIGIRKVLGAAVTGIVSSLSLNFIKWIIVANIIGLPLGYFLMNKWLEDYPYRVSIGFDLLLIVFITSMVVAFIATGYQSIKAALTNPVKSIRYE